MNNSTETTKSIFCPLGFPRTFWAPKCSLAQQHLRHSCPLTQSQVHGTDLFLPIYNFQMEIVNKIIETAKVKHETKDTVWRVVWGAITIPCTIRLLPSRRFNPEEQKPTETLEDTEKKGTSIKNLFYLLPS